MKSYKVKVIELHTDIVIVEAENEEEAKDIAAMEAKCQYDCVYDYEILSEVERNTA